MKQQDKEMVPAWNHIEGTDKGRMVVRNRFNIGLYCLSMLLFACSDTSRQQEIRGLVEELRMSKIAIVEMHRPVPVSTKVTKQLISFGADAIPQLVAALASDSPMQVGYAAFCLMQLKDESGRGAAATALEVWKSQDTTIMETLFAVRCLEDYLRAFR